MQEIISPKKATLQKNIYEYDLQTQLVVDNSPGETRIFIYPQGHKQNLL